MKILCIDSSTANLSLALADNGKIISYKNVILKKNMSAAIVPSIDKILSAAKWQLKDIGGFIAGIGPGSFTSLRVGLATIKGFAFANHTPVLGVASLDVLAAAVKTRDEQICVITDAKRQNVYSAVYERVGGKIVRVSEYGLGPVESVIKPLQGPVVVTGDALGMYKDDILKSVKSQKALLSFTTEAFWKPQAKFLPELGGQTLTTQKKSDLSALLPMYLYPEDCQVRR